MRQQVLAHLGVNFKFYRRNRLLFAAGSLVLAITSLSTVVSLFSLTNSQYLDLITSIASDLSSFATLLSIGLVLLLVSHHLDNRAIKLIITKPSPPAEWLFSASLSALAITATFYVVILLLCTALFFAWSIPFQWGLAFVLLNDFAHTLVWVGYAGVLSVLLRPVVAMLVMTLFQENLFYFLKLVLASASESATGAFAFLLTPARVLIDIVYMLTPMTNLFGDKNEQVYKSLRGTDAAWASLFPTFSYSLGAWIFCLVLASYFLNKKRFG